MPRHNQPGPLILSYQCGRQTGPLPVMLHFAINNKPVFPTAWTVADARNMALALLKQCELIERQPVPKLEIKAG